MPQPQHANPFHKGTNLKTLFTNLPRERYRAALMFLFIAAALASIAPQTTAAPPVTASVQARATIRIISGAEVHFGDVDTNDSLPPRYTTIRSLGVDQPATLIEFQ